ncbi:MAG: putative toxin-antitoxin system toxin component, PIN family [bacterium]|nr:putative toxin-antitoxin system toxin component, PIN family [bacterium]
MPLFGFARSGGIGIPSPRGGAGRGGAYHFYFEIENIGVICYCIGMIVTVDTNVIFSALYSNRGASHQILKLIVDKKIQLALSTQVYFEYYDALTRNENLEKLNLSFEEIEDILDLLALLAKNSQFIFYSGPTCWMRTTI